VEACKKRALAPLEYFETLRGRRDFPLGNRDHLREQITAV
jgi:hypothetical protein